MRKTYTREQIEKAIDHWTKVLNETKSKIVDELILEFGHKIVTDSSKAYELSDIDLKKIVQILNYYLFDNEHTGFEITWWNEKQIVDRLNQNALKSGVDDYQCSSARCYGVYSAVCKDVLDSEDNIIDINISEDIIMMNKTYLKKCTFIFAVSCICHELIHYYDRFTKENHDNTLLESINQKNMFDDHKDKLFQEKMKEAIENGINVIERPNKNKSYDDLNSEAFFTLEKVLIEDDLSASLVNKNTQKVVMRGKKSHIFMFADFD